MRLVGHVRARRRRPAAAVPDHAPDLVDTAGTVSVLPRLTSLRALAALAVLVVHLDAWDVASLPYGISGLGGTGVAFFFVLSGFVLAWGTRADLPVLTFYRRRFARVYPSDAAILVVSMVVPVVAVHRDTRAAAANALMVQAWFTDDRVVYGMNGVSWSLSCEAFFYAIFPVAVLLVRRVPMSVSWSFAGLGLALAVAAYQAAPELADHFPLVRASEFLLGLVAGVAFREGWRPRLPPVLVWGGLIAAGATSVWLASPVVNVVMAVPFLVLVIAMAERDVQRRRGWLTRRGLVFAGEASYAFYLVHELVIVNMLPVLPGNAVVEVVAITAVATCAALALHLAVERPFNRLLRDRAPSLALAPPEAAGSALSRGTADEDPVTRTRGWTAG